jgi:hypothetical protein
MGGACSMNRKEEKLKKLWSENLKGRLHSEDLGVYRKIKLEWMLGKKCFTGCTWIRLGTNRGPL